MTFIYNILVYFDYHLFWPYTPYWFSSISSKKKYVLIWIPFGIYVDCSLSGLFTLSFQKKYFSVLVFASLRWLESVAVIAKDILSTFLILLSNTWREKIARVFWSIWIFEVTRKKMLLWFFFFFCYALI